MPNTFWVSVDLDSSKKAITVSAPTPNTTIKSGDEVVWTVGNADRWKLSITFHGGATMRSSGIIDELIAGTSHPVRRAIKAPRGTGSYNDNYTVTLKGSASFNADDEITATSYLMIERNVEPTGGNEHPHCHPPRERRPNASCPGGAGAPDPSGEEQRLEG